MQAQETCIPETFKHSRPIKPHDFGHVHRCQFLSGTSFSRLCQPYNAGAGTEARNFRGAHALNNTMYIRQTIYTNRSLTLVPSVSPIVLSSCIVMSHRQYMVQNLLDDIRIEAQNECKFGQKNEKWTDLMPRPTHMYFILITRMFC